MSAKRYWLAAVVLAVAFSGTSAWAAEGGGFFGKGRPLATCLKETIAKLRQLRDDLDLSDSQKADVAAILRSHRDEIVGVIKDVYAKRRTLMDQVRADVVDERAIRRAASDLSSAIGDAAVLRARVGHEVRGVLTAEQRRRADGVTAEIEKMWDKAIGDLGR